MLKNMKIITKDTLLIVLLICNCGKAKLVKTCDKSISLKCSPHSIKIVDINTLSSIATKLLEQCNTHQECHVLNSDEECTEVTYWCTRKGELRVVQPFSPLHIRRRTSLPSLVSKGYINYSFQEAQNIICNFTLPDEGGGTSRNLTIRINELAPFVNSTDYCLYVGNSGKKPFCSGSGMLYIPYGPIPGSNNWQISLNLSQDATDVPLVRFWIDITVTPGGTFERNLYCVSQLSAATSTDNSDVGAEFHWKVFIPTTSAFCGLCALLAIFAVGCLIKNRRQSSTANQPPTGRFHSDESLYQEISNEHEIKRDCPPPPLPPLPMFGHGCLYYSDLNSETATPQEDAYLAPCSINAYVAEETVPEAGPHVLEPLTEANEPAFCE